MPDNAEQLRALHRTPPILVLPNAWDAASARLIEAEGFPAIATTSAGVAAALGYPDGGVVPSNEMIEAIARIARAVKVPVTADIEHAYGATPDAVADVVLRVIAAGAVGINLEDCVPGATDLEPLALQVDKIKAIVKASTKAGVRVVINARTDGFLRGFGAPETRLGVAIERGKAFLEAGADCVFVPGRARRGDDRRAREGHRRTDQHARGRRLAVDQGARGARRRPRQPRLGTDARDDGGAARHRARAEDDRHLQVVHQARDDYAEVNDLMK